MSRTRGVNLLLPAEKKEKEGKAGQHTSNFIPSLAVRFAQKSSAISSWAEIDSTKYVICRAVNYDFLPISRRIFSY